MQPQSDQDIRPVVEELQRLDPLVGVMWNPKARMVKKGSYSPLGKRTDAEYEGLWQVIRWKTPGLTDRGYVVLCTVTHPVRVGRRQILMMEMDGPYAPIESWLVEYMQTWDAAQRQFAASMDEVWAQHDRADSIKELINDKAAHQEAAERVYREHGGGEYWMGGAQGRASPEAAAALWPAGFGKGKRSVDNASASAAVSTT